MSTLAENQDGHALISVLRVQEPELGSSPGLTHARVVARHDDKVLLVFSRREQRWQLAGGAIEANESTRDCATRELLEESSHDCAAEALRFLCVFELRVGPTRFNPETHTELGALYEVDIHHIASFIPNEEIGATLWWNGSKLSHELDGIDRKLIELAGELHQRVA
jgi:8-oxo-dGTP diphosphatase